MLKQSKCLVVEDEFLMAELFSAMLTNMGLDVCGTADTAKQAVQLAEAYAPDLVLMDFRLRGIRDGVDAAKEIHRRLAAPVIFITGSREPATIDRIGKDNPAAVMFKPIRFEQFRRTIMKVLE